MGGHRRGRNAAYKAAGKICSSPHGRHADDRQTAPVFVRLQDRPRRQSQDRRLRSQLLSECRCVMRSLAAGARTHLVSLYKFVLRAKRHRDGLLLPDKSAAKHGVSRFWRTAGNVCDRIGDRSCCRETGCFGRRNSTPQFTHRWRPISIRPDS